MRYLAGTAPNRAAWIALAHPPSTLWRLADALTLMPYKFDSTLFAAHAS